MSRCVVGLSWHTCLNSLPLFRMMLPALPCPANCLPCPALPPPQVVVQALVYPEALNKSFDLVAQPEGQGEPTQQWDVLFDQTTSGL